jgi:hypothetical protein
MRNKVNIGICYAPRLAVKEGKVCVLLQTIQSIGVMEADYVTFEFDSKLMVDR